MKTRRILLLSAAVLCLPFMVFCKGVSYKTAMQAAGNFAIQHGYPGIILSSKDTLGILSGEISLLSKKTPLCYEFQLKNQQGFILMGADDRFTPVLGYSFSGNGGSSKVPPAYTGFIQDMEREMLQVINGNTLQDEAARHQWQQLLAFPFVPKKSPADQLPLISSRWDQGCFYNAGCPNDTVAKTSCLHALAGSGAIAMAQMVKFYKYPAHGAGEHGYVHPKYGIQYANFGATNYDYTLMPDTLTGLNDMVSKLIYQCGVAQNMDYAVLNSGSDSTLVDTALVKYFTYPSSAGWKWRADFSVATWMAMLKTELDASHPLLYHGSDSGTGGGYFICDGYQGADFFHFNWGWGGAYDGYFYLNNLAPGVNNFTSSQGAIFNLAPVPPVPDTYTMDFESVPDFSLTFNDWTVNDVDKQDTYGLSNHTFLHQGQPMAFLCFNPAQVVPSMATDQAIQPHGGQKFGACFNSNPPSNNDWIISPRIQLGVNGNFSFWTKSYTGAFGLDNYTVAVSTTGNDPGSFTVISGGAPLQTTLTWTKKSYSLAAFNGLQVYVAIHCVSNDHFLMMIDDLAVKTHGASTLSADFSADKTVVMAGDSISFSDQSGGGPTSWHWTFPGATPATSDMQNPANIRYEVPGTYLVKLKISNGPSADSVTRSGYISVIGYPSSMSLDFESLSDFTLSFNPWTLLDVGGGNTYGILQQNGFPYSFPYSSQPMAYICFNPSKTNPAMTDLLPHAGQKLGCCFSSMPPNNPNNKWLITPRMSLGKSPVISFWVKTYDALYGNEMYNVAVSTTNLSPASFTKLTPVPASAPADWTFRSYDLTDYVDKNVYIGIQCVTDTGFIFMIDDISITSTLGVNTKGTRDTVVVYPNPCRDMVTLLYPVSHPQPLSVDMVNGMGLAVRSWHEPLFGGSVRLDVSNLPVGIYLLRISQGKENIIRKLSIIN
ncbi:MAG: C10 family peptidase [Bacteroidota bacterium]